MMKRLNPDLISISQHTKDASRITPVPLSFGVFQCQTSPQPKPRHPVQVVSPRAWPFSLHRAAG